MPPFSSLPAPSPRQSNVLQKADRDGSRRPSPSSLSPTGPGGGGASSQRRIGPAAGANGDVGGPVRSRPPRLTIDTTNIAPPVPGYPHSGAPRLALNDVNAPCIGSPASVDSCKMLGRTAATPVNGHSANNNPNQLALPVNLPPGQQSEASIVHQHIQEISNKRISTLDYLRKAHEGRVYWFNTLLFDKSDLARMPYFDSRRLARRATNHLFLGLSLPSVIDVGSCTPLEFLRSLNILLSEYDAFQQLHAEHGSASSSLSRARLPQMFRRSAPGSKVRRTSNAAEVGYPHDGGDGGGANGTHNNSETTAGSTLGGGGGGGGGNGAAAGSAAATASAISLAASETELLPGEEYTHLLTPSIPFEPDYFETFATLCDVLIDTYQRLLTLVPTPRECAGNGVAELFTKADGKLRKIIIQGTVKEFEDASRQGVKTEVANVAKVVLGGLM